MSPFGKKGDLTLSLKLKQVMIFFFGGGGVSLAELARATFVSIGVSIPANKL